MKHSSWVIAAAGIALAAAHQRHRGAPAALRRLHGCFDVDRDVYLKYPEGVHYP